jgi:hypothetical protein
MYLLRNAYSRRTLFQWRWLAAVAALLLAGVVYRVTASRLGVLTKRPIDLPVPLSEFPAQINVWAGQDVPIAANVRRSAGHDAVLNRLYTNGSNGEWANVYIAYSARPRTMLGHRPEICYVAGGWIHDNTVQASFVSSSGIRVPCLIQRFHRRAPETEEIVVLNFYIMNGQVTANERGFSGLGWRTPNIAGDPARYVAHIQISSGLEDSVRAAAKDMTGLFLDFFPDASGKVRAMEYTTSGSNILK